ncbi:hypothetical protein [Lysobacter xanthus]
MQHPWPFTDPVNAAAFTSSKVALANAPVLVVVHDHEGEWQFLHGELSDEDECVTVSLGGAVDRDPTLAELAEMPSGWFACRESVGAPWSREAYELSEHEA